jgi:hypothetical protein
MHTRIRIAVIAAMLFVGAAACGSVAATGSHTHPSSSTPRHPTTSTVDTGSKVKRF